MATVTPSSNTRTPNPANHIKTTSSTAPAPHPVDILKGGRHGYASQALGVSRQTVLQKVKRGELRAVLTRTGRRTGLRIEIPRPQDGLF